MFKGFKEFIVRGNLVELAVAFIIATTFATVIAALVEVIMGLVGKIGGQPDFSEYRPAGLEVGAFINAVVTFVLVAAIVYYFVVVPYNRLKERRAKGEEEPTTPSEEVALLIEIRDLLAARQGAGTSAPAGGVTDTRRPPA
ncbi:MAG: large conductance mechanosensitive channel protein MscL [Nocardioidaceae bacterium]